MAIVSGLGIDKSNNGNIMLTVQIISPSQSGVSQTEPGSVKPATVQITSEGVTLSDAANNLITCMGAKPYLGHVQLLVISEDAAKDGLDKIWDFMERDPEFTRTFQTIVAKNGTAKSVLEVKCETGNIVAAQISKTNANEDNDRRAEIKAFRGSQLLSNPLTGIVTGVIDCNGADLLKLMKVEGSAGFKQAKFAGYLDITQTKGYLFAKNQMHSSLLTIENPKEPGKFVSIYVIKSSGKLKADMKDGKPKLDIEIEAYGTIEEMQGSTDLTKGEGIKTLKNETEALITDYIKSMLRKSQMEFNCDILGFNEILYKHDYNQFIKIKENWNEVYTNTDIGIKVKFTLKRPGIITKPAFKE
jgi:spore germination protein KC